MPRLRNRHTRKRKRILGGKLAIPTFHIVIATGGRGTLKGMIDSLKEELKRGDALTIIFDGKSAKKNSGYSDEWTADMKCVVSVKEEIPGLKFYGHLTLNKHIPLLQPVTTFVMFADDDDTYIEGSFDILRRKCVEPTTLYITRMRNSTIDRVIPSPGSTTIVRSNIGKPNGVIPFNDAGKSAFGTTYTGDYDYYNGLKNKVAKIVFLDDIVYLIGREIGNVSNGNVNKKQSGGNKKNLALIFYGRVDSYEHSLEHLNTIFRNPKFNCKVFCSLNLKATNNYIEEFRKHFEIGDEQIHIEQKEVPKWYLESNKHVCENTSNPGVSPCYSSYSLLYHTHEAFKLLEKYKQTHKMEFDVVFVYRADLNPDEKEFPIGEVKENTVFIPKDDKKNGSNFYPNGITSLAAYGDFNVMKKYCNLINNITTATHIEMMLLEYLKKMNINIERFTYYTTINPQRRDPKYKTMAA